MVDLFGLKILKEAILATLKGKKKKVTTAKDSGAKKTVKTVKLTTVSDGNIDGTYENGGFCFAACSPMEKGAVKQLFNVRSCREGAIAHYRRCVTGAHGESVVSKRHTSLMVWVCKGTSEHPSDVVNGDRMSITYEEFMARAMSTAVIIINALEKRNKWLPTKAYKAEHGKGSRHIIYYFRGSRWWQYAPHTLSLLMLIIRLSKHTSLHKLKKNSSADDVIKAILAIRSGRDEGHARTAGKWLALLDNRRVIYKDRSLVANWEAFSSGAEGIRRLTDGEAADSNTQKNFRAVKKK